jgi:hypothetical protein
VSGYFYSCSCCSSGQQDQPNWRVPGGVPPRPATQLANPLRQCHPQVTLAHRQEENPPTTAPPPIGDQDGGPDASLSGSSCKMRKIATYNIQSGRNSRLEMALRALARRLSRRTPRFHNGQWTCPPVVEALRACGMHPIAVYIHNRREQIGPYVSGRAIYAACVNSTRPAGTPTRLQFWWEQRDLPGQNGLQAEEHSDSEEE